MATTDILINVRLVYKGETSLTTLESMRYGGIVIVRNFGWYAELPEDSVVFVDDPSEVVVTLRNLLKDPTRLELTKQQSIKYIEKNHSHNDYAKKMYELIKTSV